MNGVDAFAYAVISRRAIEKMRKLTRETPDPLELQLVACLLVAILKRTAKNGLVELDALAALQLDCERIVDELGERNGL